MAPMSLGLRYITLTSPREVAGRIRRRSIGTHQLSRCFPVVFHQFRFPFGGTVGQRLEEFHAVGVPVGDGVQWFSHIEKGDLSASLQSSSHLR
uniref:Uncharacterized protein n=1 Tax=Lactuca sativa TaxID=4236 RepID=A0A9R1VJF4_LACSA|nr:hypothetical protein LSAT_V11C500261060 [Lactuca sativa]